MTTIIRPPPFILNCGDAIAFLQQLPDASVDLIVTDPAYESLEKHRKTGTTTRLKHSKSSSNDWFPIFPNTRFKELFAEMYRVLKKNAHCYVMCDSETMFFIKPIGEKAGFKFWKPVVWNKSSIGMGYHYRAQTEFILFFEKGKRKLNLLGMPDYLDEEYYTGPDSIWLKRLKGNTLYPTEKPSKLSQILISQSAASGQFVVDPFMGSGSVGEAALHEHCYFIGNDIQPASVQLVERRLGTVSVPPYPEWNPPENIIEVVS